jgi:hypothetical protein
MKFPRCGQQAKLDRLESTVLYAPLVVQPNASGMRTVRTPTIYRGSGIRGNGNMKSVLLSYGIARS